MQLVCMFLRFQELEAIIRTNQQRMQEWGTRVERRLTLAKRALGFGGAAAKGGTRVGVAGASTVFEIWVIYDYDMTNTAWQTPTCVSLSF